MTVEKAARDALDSYLLRHTGASALTDKDKSAIAEAIARAIEEHEREKSRVPEP